MKLRSHILALLSLAFLSSTFTFNSNQKNLANNDIVSVNAATSIDPDNYYDNIADSLTGDELKSALIDLNASKKKSTVGYSAMGTTTNGQFKYTDYDPTTIEYDSNGQPYGTKIISFYSGTSITSFNREHVWPKSHGGNLVEGDIHMPRPTLESENGSRGNSFYVEGKKSSTNGWDPAEESFGIESYRGDSARIVFYCAIANSNLSLIDEEYHYTTNSNRDNLMGKLSDLLKWNLKYSVDERERRRNAGAEYLQGNRNPFIDHPEYACKIWGNTNATTKQICGSSYQESAPTKLELSETELTLSKNETVSLTVSATPTDASKSVTWTTSNSSVATVSNNGLVKAIGKGNATITATSTADTTISASCSITVTESEIAIVSNSIKDCYSIASGTAVSDIYGIYVGSGDGNNPIIMNGEYGMLLYGVSIDSSWVKNETVLKVNGTLDIYKNLYELKNCSTTLVTDIDEIAQNVSSVVSYNVTGGETTSNKDLANRLCLVSGTIVTASASNNDYQATMTLSNSKTVNLFVKSTYKSTLENVIVAGASLTLKGFTSFYNNFQIQIFENVAVDDNYTAENFAADLMNKTNSICASSLNKKKELSPVWIDLEQNYYSKLSSTEKTILINSNASYKSGTAIEQAMDRYDYIVNHYLLNNFIAREINRTDFRFDLSSSETSLLIVIVSISALSLTAIFSVSLIIRKKKTTK